jgi:acyl-CoA synthetase (AMP-forming)/AMP-acid ligase II
MIDLIDRRARVVDAATDTTLSATALALAADRVARTLEGAPEGPVLCLVRPDLNGLLAYLGALRCGRPAILWDAGSSPGRVAALTQRFLPAAVIGLDPAAGARLEAPYAPLDGPGGDPLWIRRADPVAPCDGRLALMLGTSGSTGEPRLVRQSAAGVMASARAIRSALDIDPGDVAVTSLPLHYTLGLSVVHSNLYAGATVVLESRGVIEAGFWRTVNRHGVTAIAGVPHSFELLAKLPWTPERSPTVRSFSVSGGRLRDTVVQRFHDATAESGGGMYVMYGQTEAGSRICVLPPARLPEKLGSVGPPIPGMRLTIEDPDPDGYGEVVCHSAGVMMGYADSSTDLARGDDQRGTLRTGDVGRLDEDGFLWLRGRRSRIGKAFGVRVDLDAVEHTIAGVAPAAALADGDRLRIWCEDLTRNRYPEVTEALRLAFGVHRLGVIITSVDRLPRLSSGKVDYRALDDRSR